MTIFSPRKNKYSNIQLLNHANAVMTLIGVMSKKDIQSIEKSIINQILQRMIDLLLYEGKQPLNQKEKYYNTLAQHLQDCSDILSVSEFIGFVFSCCDSLVEDDKDLFSLLFIDYVLYLCLLKYISLI